MLQSKFKLITILLSLLFVLGLNILHVSATGSSTLQVNFSWEGPPASDLTVHLRQKLPDQDGYLVVDTITTSQNSHLFSGLNTSLDYDVVVDPVANYTISYNQVGNVITVVLDKVYQGTLSFPTGTVEFQANGHDVFNDYPNFEFVTTLTLPDGSQVDLVNMMWDDGTIDIYGNLDYPISKPGLYSLTISQVNLGYQNFTFDDSLFRVDYVVTANGFNLNLASTTIYKDDVIAPQVIFQNTYVSLPVEVTLPVSMATTPVTGWNEVFQVGMYDILPFGEFLNSTKAIDYPTEQGNSFSFYMFPNTDYQAKIKQIANDSPYYLYDDNTFTVTLEADQYGLVTRTIIDNNGVQDAIIFTNVYQPIPTGISLPFEKQVLNYQDDSNPSFDFLLVPEEDYEYANIKNETPTITILDDSIHTNSFFLEFTQPGIYYFTLSELEGNDPDYIYDKSEYRIVAAVTDNKGILSVILEYFRFDEPVDVITFNNYFSEKQEEIVVPPIINVNKEVTPPELADETAADEVIATGDAASYSKYLILIAGASLSLAFVHKQRTR